MKMLEEFVEMLQQDFRKIHKLDFAKRIILVLILKKHHIVRFVNTF